MDQQHVQQGQHGQGDAGEIRRAAPCDPGPAVVGALDQAPHPDRCKAGTQRGQQVHHQQRRQQSAAGSRRQESCNRTQNFIIVIKCRLPE